MNIQIVDKLTQEHLIDEQKATLPKAHWQAMNLGTISRFVVRGCAVVLGLASTAAVSLVAVVSFGAYGMAMLLGKIRPLRDAFQFLSRAYDRSLERLGREILQDPRDFPALRLMVSLSLTVVPIFLAQLVLGKPRLWLVIAFYLALYGVKFQRVVRMFSSKHLEAHRPHGFFSEKYQKVLGRYVEFFLGYFYGDLPELGRTVHVRLHHKENGGPDDTVFCSEYDRTNPIHFLWFLSDNTWTALGLSPYFYFASRGDEKNRRRVFWGMARYYIYFGAVFIYNWRIGIAFVLIPLLSMNFIMAIAAWVQHAFCDPEHPDDYFANTVTVFDEVNFMNEGYHLCHHHRSSLHWTEMPAHLDRLRDKMKESGSLVFRDLDFMELFFELTLLRRLDVLAEKLVPWESMNHEEKVALLAKRTKPISAIPA